MHKISISQDPKWSIPVKSILLKLQVLVLVFACFSDEARAVCDPLPPESEEVLTVRFDSLESQIRAIPDKERGSPHYRQLQEAALLELEQLQCVREAQSPAEDVKRGPNIETPFVEIPVLFATDRQSITSAEGRHTYFGGGRASSGVTLGKILVTMPAERFEEGWALPVGMRVIKVKDTSAGVTASKPDTFTQTKLAEEIRVYKTSLPTNTRSRLLVFVHGFNVTYADAAKATARLAFGLRVNLLPIAISWPSQGATLRYWQDEQSVETSIERFRPVFGALLTMADVDEVLIVGHSMGTRLITRVLSQLDLQKAKLDKLWRVVYAAADLGEEELRELWPRIEPLGQKGWTFYTSANDVALMASRIIHGFPRVGDSKDRVFSIDKSETIDASAIAPFLRNYGHSYLIDNPLLQADLRRWVVQGSAANARGLRAGNRPPAVFWELPK
jgi:esterase/lipase superfamily enzyme